MAFISYSRPLGLASIPVDHLAYTMSPLPRIILKTLILSRAGFSSKVIDKLALLLLAPKSSVTFRLANSSQPTTLPRDFPLTSPKPLINFFWGVGFHLSVRSFKKSLLYPRPTLCCSYFMRSVATFKHYLLSTSNSLRFFSGIVDTFKVAYDVFEFWGGSLYDLLVSLGLPCNGLYCAGNDVRYPAANINLSNSSSSEPRS